MPHHYYADIRVDGMLWYHYKSVPSSKFYISQPPPVIHNYGFILALAGYIADPDTGYVSKFNMKKYKKPKDLYKKYGIYAYPLLIVHPILGEVLMSGNNEGLLTLRGTTRLAYPTFTKNVVFMPGSKLRTVVISRDPLPRRLIVNIGARRAGVLLVKLVPIRPEIVNNALVTHPYNVKDTGPVYNQTIILPHPAGDVALYGVAEKAYKYTVKINRRTVDVIVPIIR